MKYIPRHQYLIKYDCICKQINKSVQITTLGAKNMSLGSGEIKILLGKTECSEVPCIHMNNCEHINNAREISAKELLN